MSSAHHRDRERICTQQKVEDLKVEILRLTGKRTAAEVELRFEQMRVEELRASTERGKE